MPPIKTRPTGESVTAFIDGIASEARRVDAHELRATFERITGAPATMWGPSIIGFGTQPYTNTTGTNDWFIVGFSPRQQAMTIYGIHDGYGPPDPMLDRLGPHTTGKSCLYVKRLDDIDRTILEELIVGAWLRSASR